MAWGNCAPAAQHNFSSLKLENADQNVRASELFFLFFLSGALSTFYRELASPPPPLNNAVILMEGARKNALYDFSAISHYFLSVFFLLFIFFSLFQRFF